jgi:transposase-like protein
MGKPNRTHTPAFKAQVALAAIKGDRTISQVAAHYELHVNLVAHWKRQLLEGAAAVFDPQGENTPPPDARARASLTKVLSAGRKVRDKLLDHAEVVIDRLDPAAEASRLIASFGNSPASSGSTPAPSPSANS